MDILTKFCHLPKLLCSVAFFFHLGCSYRFTNLSVAPPPGIKSIAVESIYDTTQKAIPHEILWENVQRAFIKNGRLKVTSSENADAYIKIHLKDANSVQQNEILIQPKIDERKLVNNSKGTPSPKDFRNLTRAGSVADDESQFFNIHVEIWNLKTGDILMSKTYNLSSPRYKIIDNSTTVENQFLRAEEAYKYNFQFLSEKVANNIVQDFIRTR